MKQKKLAAILAFTISFEMMMAPVVGYAQSTTSSSSNTASNIANAIDTAARIYSTVSGAMGNNTQSPQTTYDMQQLQLQQTPSTDKFFNLQKLSQIPGLVDYLAINNINPQMLECKTLPTTLFEAKNEVCRIGVTTDRGAAPQGQLNEMYSYYNQYFQIDKMYRNFSANSNSGGQLYGVGCMNNAMEILNGFFKYRLNELDKLTTNLEALQAQFKEASRSDMDAIEEAVAVLDGGDSTLVNKVKNKNPDLFDYGKRFNNPACTSMMTADKYNEIGKSGLNAINKTLKNSLTAKPPGSKFSGESYSTSHNSVVEDINSLADKVAKQFQLGYQGISADPSKYGAFLKDLKGSVSSPNGLNGALSADIFADSQTKFAENAAKLSDERSAIMNELSAAGINPSAANSLLGNLNTSNFENEVTALQNQIQNTCLQKNLSGSSTVEAVLNRVYTQGLSSHANKNAANFLKDKIASILSNTQTSLETKISELKTLESQEGNRYVVKMDSTREVQYYDEASGSIKTKLREATQLQTPSSFFVDTIENCKAQFKVNKLGSQMSGASAIQRLRTLNNNYKSLASTSAAQIKNEMKQKLINCASPEDATNSVVGSCTPARFDTSSSSFCAAGALSCSQNMQACTAQAVKYVTEIKAQKTARVNNYKALVEKNKKDIIKIFDTALAKYMQDGEKLRGVFGAGFSSPSGIQRNVVPEGSKYLSELQQATAGSDDGTLLLEDPDKYVDMFKNNIALLKKSVEDQQNQILGGSSVGNSNGLLAQHIKQTENNYKAVQREASKMADACISKHDDYLKAQESQRAQAQAEAQKAQSELGEKRSKVCNLYDSLNISPGPVCNQDFKDLMQFDSRNMVRLVDYCNEIGFNDDNGGVDTRAMKICSSNSKSKTANADLTALCDKYQNPEKFCPGPAAGENIRPSCDAPGISDRARAQLIAKASVDSQVSANNNEDTMPDVPAYCTAGNNSGREVQDGAWGMINNTVNQLNQQINGGATAK